MSQSHELAISGAPGSGPQLDVRTRGGCTQPSVLGTSPPLAAMPSSPEMLRAAHVGKATWLAPSVVPVHWGQRGLACTLGFARRAVAVLLPSSG